MAPFSVVSAFHKKSTPVTWWGRNTLRTEAGMGICESTVVVVVVIVLVVDVKVVEVKLAVVVAVFKAVGAGGVHEGSDRC